MTGRRYTPVWMNSVVVVNTQTRDDGKVQVAANVKDGATMAFRLGRRTGGQNGCEVN